MNIFNKVALQGLKKNRTRTLVTIVGVILSAAMVTAVTTFGVSLLNYLINGSISKYGGWHAAFLDVDSSFIREQAVNDKLAATAVFDNIGYAGLDGGQNPDKPYLFIAGFTDETFTALPITLLSGRLPENSGEILISSKVASDGGVSFKVGDTLSLSIGNRMDGDRKLSQGDPYAAGRETFVPQAEKTYTVVGTCRRSDYEEVSAPGYTLITKADDRTETDSFSLFVTLKNPRQVRAYVNSTGKHAYVLNDNVLRFMGISDDNLFNMFMYPMGGIVIAIIMLGSIFLIYNSFNMSLNERTQQFGILSSVGATAKQLRNSVLFEGFCIGMIGIPIGIAVGIISIGLVISVISQNFASILFQDVPLTLTLSTPALIAAAAVSLLTILISAYIPARKAANTPVMECIRQTNEVKIESKTIKTSRLSMRIYGLEGTLALKNFKRNKKRYRSIILSLVLSIVLFISTSALTADMKRMSSQRTEITDYDIIFSTQDLDDGQMLSLYEKLKTARGVYDALYQEVIAYSCAAGTGELSEDYLRHEGLSSTDEIVDLPVNIQFLEDSRYENILKELGLSETEYTGENAKFIAVSMTAEDDRILTVFRNSSVKITLIPETDSGEKLSESKNIDVAFVDFVPPDSPPARGNSGQKQACFQVLAPYSAKGTFEFPDASKGVKSLSFQSTDPSLSASEMETIIEGEGITGEYSLYNMYQMMDENRNYIFIANVFAYTFIVMISMIAVANVFNTISTNIKLRRRELAMLRSVGMSEHDFQKMMNFECIFYGMRALLYGLPIAVFAAWLVHKGMIVDEVGFSIPWGSIGISVFGVLFIVFITMLYTINKIKKENIIDALRDEMA